MLVSQIFDIEKKDSHLFYREDFTASARYNILGKEEVGRIEFVIEHTPVGDKTISVRLIDDIGYPLLPLMRDLKTQVHNLLEKEQLPR